MRCSARSRRGSGSESDGGRGIDHGDISRSHPRTAPRGCPVRSSTGRRADRRGQAMPPTRGFGAALRGQSRLAVIAEIKRRSPSKGDLFADLDPAALAKAYESGGAGCLSVLTDGPDFGGSVDDLQTARLACSLPVLRKDFTVCERDVLDARIMGADCVLLIAAALDRNELCDFHELGHDDRPRRARRDPRRGRAGRRAAGQGDHHRRQPTRPGHLRSRSRTCRADGPADPARRRARRRERRARSGRRVELCAAPATTPCSSASRW